MTPSPTPDDWMREAAGLTPEQLARLAWERLPLRQSKNKKEWLAYLTAIIASHFSKPQGEVGELIAEARAAYEAVALWPETKAAGISDLLILRNHVPKLLDHLAALLEQVRTLEAEKELLATTAPTRDILRRYVELETRSGCTVSTEAREPFIREFSALLTMLNGQVDLLEKAESANAAMRAALEDVRTWLRGSEPPGGDRVCDEISDALLKGTPT